MNKQSIYIYGYIYKIESPSNKIYIGQTINLNKRVLSYKGMGCKSQPRLYNSIKKHGYDNHIFEVIEKCDIEDLNERERYWQDKYNVLKELGLNCKLTTTNEKSGKLSINTIEKIRKSNIGKNKGKKRPQCIIDIISKKNKGQKRSEEFKRRLSKINKGRIVSKKTIDSLIKRSQKGVICLETNKSWDSAKKCSIDVNINYYTLMGYLNGSRTNKTSLRYVK